MISGVTRVRNEADIIQDTLDYYAGICDAGIVVFDDGSTDDTPDICEAHEAVEGVIRRKPDQRIIYTDQGDCRWRAAVRARGEWVLCFDADEWIETDALDPSVDALKFRLFDFYMTPDGNEWIGPEYRDIVMMWRKSSMIDIPVREPKLLSTSKIGFGGWVRHYGKARGLERWERKCKRYQQQGYPQDFRTKWASREGQGMKEDFLSDFGRPLIRWSERKSKGVRLG